MYRAIRFIFTFFLASASLQLSAREWYEDMKLNHDLVVIDTIPNVAPWTYHCRVALNPKQRNLRWTICLEDVDRNVLTKIVFDRPDASTDDADLGAPIDVELKQGDKSARYILNGNRKSAVDEVSIVIKQLSAKDNLYCEAGRLDAEVEFSINADEVKYITFVGQAGLTLKRLSCLDNVYGGNQDNELSSRPRIEDDELNLLLQDRSNTITGHWRYLDRDSDPRKLNLGGEYELVIGESADGGYDIFYISGARVGSGKWKCGEMKGRLLPTRFINHYNLIWIDAMGNAISNETSADFMDGSILRLNFPLYQSSVRFSKEL